MAGTKYLTKELLTKAVIKLIYPNKKKAITGIAHQTAVLDLVESLWNQYEGTEIIQSDYLSMYDLYINGTLVKGAFYVFDYTNYHLTGNLQVPVQDVVPSFSDNTESFILEATSSTTFAAEVVSLDYPLDSIEYRFDLAEDVGVELRTGLVVRRRDPIRDIDTPFDFRSQYTERGALDVTSFTPCSAIKANPMTQDSVWGEGTGLQDRTFGSNQIDGLHLHRCWEMGDSAMATMGFGQVATQSSTLMGYDPAGTSYSGTSVVSEAHLDKADLQTMCIPAGPNSKSSFASLPFGGPQVVGITTQPVKCIDDNSIRIKIIATPNTPVTVQPDGDPNGLPIEIVWNRMTASFPVYDIFIKDSSEVIIKTKSNCISIDTCQDIVLEAYNYNILLKETNDFKTKALCQAIIAIFTENVTVGRRVQFTTLNRVYDSHIEGVLAPTGTSPNGPHVGATTFLNVGNMWMQNDIMMYGTRNTQLESGVSRFYSALLSRDNRIGYGSADIILLDSKNNKFGEYCGTAALDSSWDAEHNLDIPFNGTGRNQDGRIALYSAIENTFASRCNSLYNFLTGGEDYSYNEANPGFVQPAITAWPVIAKNVFGINCSWIFAMKGAIRSNNFGNYTKIMAVSRNSGYMRGVSTPNGANSYKAEGGSETS